MPRNSILGITVCPSSRVQGLQFCTEKEDDAFESPWSQPDQQLEVTYTFEANDHNGSQSIKVVRPKSPTSPQARGEIPRSDLGSAVYPEGTQPFPSSFVTDPRSTSYGTRPTEWREISANSHLQPQQAEVSSQLLEGISFTSPLEGNNLEPRCNGPEPMTPAASIILFPPPSNSMEQEDRLLQAHPPQNQAKLMSGKTAQLLDSDIGNVSLGCNDPLPAYGRSQGMIQPHSRNREEPSTAGEISHPLAITSSEVSPPDDGYDTQLALGQAAGVFEQSLTDKEEEPEVFREPSIESEQSPTLPQSTIRKISRRVIASDEDEDEPSMSSPSHLYFSAACSKESGHAFSQTLRFPFRAQVAE